MRFELNNAECERGIRLALLEQGLIIKDTHELDIEFTKLRGKDGEVLASVGIVELGKKEQREESPDMSFSDKPRKSKEPGQEASEAPKEDKAENEPLAGLFDKE